jgi:DNA-binding LacI/PurR family transcriptional regulator
MEKNKSMHEIAASLGVSRTTVSLVLSGKSEQYKISDATKKRILDYVKQAGFVANPMARKIAKGRNDDVGIIVNIKNNNYNISKAVFGLVWRIDKSGRDYHLQYARPDEFVEVVRQMSGMGIKDVIAVGFQQTDKTIGKNLKILIRSLRIYFFDAMLEQCTESLNNCCFIGFDRAEVDKELLVYLHGLGHRRAAVDLNITPWQWSPFEKVVNFNPFPYIQNAYAKFEAGIRFVDEATEIIDKNDVTLFITHDDQFAAGLIYAFMERGIRVPEDISVTGFDNIDASKYFKVSLTTIEVPVDEMIELIVNAVVGDVKLESVTELKGKVIIRESTGPAPV